MSYNIVLTTAEDIVAVVDAVIAKGSEAAKDFIAEFTGIATDDQVLKALQMACELQLYAPAPSTPPDAPSPIGLQRRQLPGPFRVSSANPPEALYKTGYP